MSAFSILGLVLGPVLGSVLDPVLGSALDPVLGSVLDPVLGSILGPKSSYLLKVHTHWPPVEADLAISGRKAVCNNGYPKYGFTRYGVEALGPCKSDSDQIQNCSEAHC